MTLVVLREIHSSSGNSRYVRQDSKEFPRHLTAEGRSCCLFFSKSLKNWWAFFLEEGLKVNVGVRAEDLVETDGDCIFEGKVSITEELGEVTLLHFDRV
jgi:hypothetical protein